MSSQTNIILHDRPITDVRFNYDGDLLFTTCKDATASVMRLPDTMIGTFESHEGAIICMDLSPDSTRLVTGGADKLIILWDVETGTPLEKYTCDAMVKSVHFGKTIYFTSDDTLNQKPVFGNVQNMRSKKILPFVPTSSVLKYNHFEVAIGDSNGNLHSMDLRCDQIRSAEIHTDKINSLRNSFCSSFFITASNDCLSKIMDYNLNVIKTFVTENPVNSAAVFRSNDKVVCGGGLSARDVTTTRVDNAFEANLFDITTSKMVGSYGTHFGTINCVDVNPNNQMYCSGGEDGIVCLVAMGKDFKEAPFTVY